MKKTEKYQERLDELAESLVTPERYASAVQHLGSIVEPDTGVSLIPEPPNQDYEHPQKQ